jgi:tetratricopeptide (TPR) repeat protein
LEHKHVRLFAAVAVLCFSRSAWGQIPEADRVKGEVQVDSRAVLRSTVTLSDLRGHHTLEAVEVKGDGTFEFRHVPYGEYRLTVFDAGERPIHDELVSVHGQQSEPILVQVPMRETPRPPAGTISAAALLHPPTKKAFQDFLAARKFADAGAYDKAAGQLENAVRLSPGYADAWINLAAQHIHMGRYEQALQELAHASEISKPTAMILVNMAFAQHALHQDEEAIRSARQALRLDPSYAPAHYLLGSFLAPDRRTLPEAIQHLEVAARVMPGAQANLDRAKRDLVQTVTHP